MANILKILEVDGKEYNILDANYVHTDNNYTTTEKNKLANINPATTVTDISTTSTAGNATTYARGDHQHKIASNTITSALGYTPLNSNLKGANSGLAELDANGKVPSSQLPSYVDDVLEYSAKANFPTTGETGKIYVDTGTNLTYRWSGSAYVEISPSLALGETSSTAYRGDRGKTAYNHATDSNKLTTAKTSGFYKFSATAEGHIGTITSVAKSDITNLLGLTPTDNTGTVTSVATGAGLTGGTITGSGTIKADLKSETKSTLEAAAKGSAANREYAVGLDKNGDLSVNIPWENTQTITGVKGNAESSYRTGNVNLTPTNIGLGNVGNFKAVSTVASQGLTNTEKSNARANIGAGTSNLTIGTTSTTAMAGNKTFPTSIATSTGTNQLTLAANTKYAITAGGTSYIFTTPSTLNASVSNEILTFS